MSFEKDVKEAQEKLIKKLPFPISSWIDDNSIFLRFFRKTRFRGDFIFD